MADFIDDLRDIKGTREGGALPSETKTFEDGIYGHILYMHDETSTIEADVQADRDAIQILHDTVVAKEALVNPHYDNIDIVAGISTAVETTAADTVALNEIYDNRVEIYAVDENAAIATTKANEAAISESNADLSATAAAASELVALAQATVATEQAVISTDKASEAAVSETNAATSAGNAATSESNSSVSETNAANSAAAALSSEQAAAIHDTSAQGSAQSAAASESSASTSRDLAERYANEDEDVEVEIGKYSALHWAAKSQLHAGDKLSIDANLSDLSDVDAAKTVLGINNVDNTSDLDKPIAIATQEALDDKADISLLSSNITLYPTTAVGDFGYNRLVSDISDSDYDDVAVDIPTGAINTDDLLLASLIADAGLFTGNPGIITIPTIGNIQKTSGNSTQYAGFYFQIFKRDSLGVEELLNTSFSTGEVNPVNGDYRQFSASTILNNGTWLETDRLVIKYYAELLGGVGSEYNFQFGGDNPVRTQLPVPVSVIPTAEHNHNTDYLGINDTAVDSDKLGNRLPSTYQDTLVSNVHVKTVNGTSILGPGDISTIMSPASILASLKTVDGSGSGLDADLFDGLESSAYSLAHTHPYASDTHNHSGTYEPADSDIVKAPGDVLPSLDGSQLTNLPASGLTDTGHSFNTNGYQRLSNGLIFQWGYISGGSTGSNNNFSYQSNSFSFPIAFPSHILNIVSQAHETATSYGATAYVKSFATTGATIEIVGGYNSGYANGAFWYAIGY